MLYLVDFNYFIWIIVFGFSMPHLQLEKEGSFPGWINALHAWTPSLYASVSPTDAWLFNSFYLNQATL